MTLFRSGRCSWQTEYGNGPSIEHQPDAAADAAERMAELLRADAQAAERCMDVIAVFAGMARSSPRRRTGAVAGLRVDRRAARAD